MCSENGTVDADLSDPIFLFIHHYHLLSYYYSTSIVVVVINVRVTLFSENCIDTFNQRCFLYSLGSTTTQATNCSGFPVLSTPTF